MSKLFVGFNFSPESSLAKKITGFRRRFDPKFNQYSFSHMAMLAPFEVNDGQVESLSETLKEEFESFFYGNPRPNLGFTGLGVFQHKKKNILYLNPHYGTNLDYCSEIVLEICKDHMRSQLRYKENNNQFLPLGYFQSIEDLNIVMEQAQIEFTNFAELSIDSISLYEKKYGIWTEKETLIQFEQKDSPFLQINQASI